MDPIDGRVMIRLLREEWSEDCTVGTVLLALQVHYMACTTCTCMPHCICAVVSVLYLCAVICIMYLCAIICILYLCAVICVLYLCAVIQYVYMCTSCICTCVLLHAYCICVPLQHKSYTSMHVPFFSVACMPSCT